MQRRGAILLYLSPDEEKLVRKACAGSAPATWAREELVRRARVVIRRQEQRQRLAMGTVRFDLQPDEAVEVFRKLNVGGASG